MHLSIIVKVLRVSLTIMTDSFHFQNLKVCLKTG